MNRTDAAIVRSILEKHLGASLHVDDRLWHEVDQPGEMFLDSLPTTDEFMSLVWQSINAARPLIPVGKPRTLRDCAARLSAFEWDFRRLVKAGFDWFQPCIDIDRSFDYSKLGLITITPLMNPEILETPTGSYYVYDGVHKTIVLAKRLLRGETDYEPVQVLLLTPRRK